ncbi:hypothetical protein AX14_008640 [Amanita brunnescens Koide BX004]|nr:hypothetical protein AX14_008640 [Amanita brunnescens Koide BX004]
MDAQLQFGAADPSITYHQGWDAGIATQQGAVADIAFNGSFITIFGTLPALADSSTNTLASTFILDNGSPTYFSANLTDQTLPNQPLFQPNATLPEGEHTIRVINGVGALQLDYFTVTPPVSSTLIQVDDTDPSVQYAGPWNATTGASANAKPNYNFSLHSARSPGANVTFSFSGTFVAVYGLYHPGPIPNVSFAIDSIPPAPLTNPPVPIIRHVPQSVLFQSFTLSDQNHTLSIYLNEDNQSEFSLDYILYQASPSSLSSSQPVAPSSAGNAGPQPASKSISTNMAGAIVGGVLGFVALLVVLFFAFKFKRYIYPSANPSPPASTSTFVKRVQRIRRLSVSVLSLRSQLRGSNAPSPIEDRRPYYVDGSGRPLRQFTNRTRSGSVGTNRTPTLPMPNIYTHASSDSSSSLLKYPPAATHQEGGPRRHHAEEDIEASAGNNNNAPTSPPRVTYGHDEKFALFGQV